MFWLESVTQNTELKQPQMNRIEWRRSPQIYDVDFKASIETNCLHALPSISPSLIHVSADKPVVILKLSASPCLHLHCPDHVVHADFSPLMFITHSISCRDRVLLLSTQRIVSRGLYVVRTSRMQRHLLARSIIPNKTSLSAVLIESAS